MRHSTSDLNKFEKLRKEKAMAAHADEKARKGGTCNKAATHPDLNRYEAGASRMPAHS
jgi:hypothetical protein